MASTIKKRVEVEADTSGMVRAAKDVEAFGRAVSSTSDVLKSAKANLSPAAYKQFAADLAPAIAAEKEMAKVARNLEQALAPAAQAMKRQQLEMIKQAEATQKLILGEKRYAETLRMRYDEAHRGATRFAQVEADVQRLVAQRNLTLEQGNVILASAGARFNQMGADAAGANDNLRLSSGQLQGLGYQVNDIGTMLAMGASPFQVMASQAGQVVQVLGEHPGGMRGSLKAVGASVMGFAASLGPVGLGIAGAATAVAGLAYALREDFPDAAETLERHSEVLAKVQDQYEGLKEQLAAIGDAEEVIGLRIELEIDRKNIERQLKEEMRNADLDFTSYLGQAAFGALDFADAPTRGAFDPIREEVDRFREALKRGEEEAVIPFREKLAYLYEVAGNDQAMRSAIESAMTYTDKLAGLTVKADEAATALERMGIAEKGGRLRITGRDQEADLMDRMNPEGADNIRQALEDQAEALTRVEPARRRVRTEAEKHVDALARLTRGGEEEVERLRREVALLGQSEGAMAEARFAADALAKAREAAAAAGRTGVDAATEANIRRQAAEVGTLTDRLREMGKAQADAKQLAEFLGDLDFRTATAGMPDVEREIQEAMRQYGVQAGSVEAERIASNMRYLDSLENVRDELGSLRDAGVDAFTEVAGAILQGENALDAFINTFAACGGPIGDLPSMIEGAAA